MDGTWIEKYGYLAVLLGALLDDPFFQWMRPFSQLMASMDEVLFGDEPVTVEGARGFVRQAHALVSPEGDDSPYAKARQRDPAVLFAHTELSRRVAAALDLFGPHALYGRYWGTIDEVSFLHFELCYYQAIEWAIANGLSSVQAGEPRNSRNRAHCSSVSIARASHSSWPSHAYRFCGAAVGPRFRRGTMVAWASPIFGLAVAGFAYATWYPLALIVLLVVSVAFTPTIAASLQWMDAQGPVGDAPAGSVSKRMPTRGKQRASGPLPTIAMVNGWVFGGAFTRGYTLGGELASAPAVGTNADGRLEVFARGATVQSRADELPLPVAGELGLTEVLLTCDDTNAASIRVIE